MALLKLPRVSRATTSSGKEFQEDATLRGNDLHLQSIGKMSLKFIDEIIKFPMRL